MKVSTDLITMLKHHEGVRYRPYQCPALLWTVGVGHVIDPKHIKIPFAKRKAISIPKGWNRKLSEEEVDAILKKDLERFERGVLRLCPTGLTQHRFDSLVSFSFNLGVGSLQKSTLRRKHNRGDYSGAGSEFPKWVRAGGKILRGLVIRRNDEMNLYLYGRAVDH